MASLSKQPNGRKMIQFMAADGKRKSIRLGKMSMKHAEVIKVKVEQLVTASITGHSVDDETARWLGKIDSSLNEKLTIAGLIERKKFFGLEEFLDEYLKLRVDVKASTIITWNNVRRNLIDFFGSDKPLNQFNQGNAEEWRLFLISSGLSESTVRKRCSIAKQFFSMAVKRELIPTNPFSELKSANLANPDRFYFVSKEESDRVMEACPDSQWRLIFALSRY